MEFSYDISAHSHRGATRDAYVRDVHKKARKNASEDGTRDIYYQSPEWKGFTKALSN